MQQLTCPAVHMRHDVHVFTPQIIRPETDWGSVGVRFTSEKTFHNLIGSNQQLERGEEHKKRRYLNVHQEFKQEGELLYLQNVWGTPPPGGEYTTQQAANSQGSPVYGSRATNMKFSLIAFYTHMLVLVVLLLLFFWTTF